jgi:uncharacterized membrane protein
MEKMLIVVFDDESKAYNASKVLTQLDASGDISVYGEAVVKKNPDSSVTIEQSSDVFPVGVAGGTAIGALVGLLGDFPVVGAASGAIAASMIDMDRAGVDVEFLGDVTSKLKSGKYALVADISEEVTAPVDSQMKALDGHVFREARKNVEDEQDARVVQSIESEIKELNKEEKAELRAEKKAETRARADALRDKLHNKLEQAKIRAADREKETKAKIKYLQEKLSKATGHAKVAIEARVHDIKKHESTVQPATPQQHA